MHAVPKDNVFLHSLFAKTYLDSESLLVMISAGGEDRFEVDPENGVVRTKGKQPFHLGREYEIGVSAQDERAPTLQKSPTHSLKIFVGQRDPQFFRTEYRASVAETAAKNAE